MKNKQIIESWNKIKPDDIATERMLNKILAHTRSCKTGKEKTAATNKTFSINRIILVSFCFFLAVAVIIQTVNNSKSHLNLLYSDKGIDVRYVNKIPNINSSDCLVYLTENELFAGVHEGYTVVIFEGTVTDVKNIRLDFGDGSDNYRAIAKIKVEKVFRGDIKPGETISILLPVAVGIPGIETSCTEISSQITEGIKGIFTPVKYDETSVREQSGRKLYLLDLAEYGLPDGERWIFLETANGLQYSDAYTSLIDPENLDDVKEYILPKIK